MQHPVAYRVLPNGSYEVTSFWGLLTNPWALLQYAHNMSGAVITASFVMCSVGAFYVLENRFSEHGRIFLRVGVIAGLDLVHHPDFSHRRLCTAATWQSTSPRQWLPWRVCLFRKRALASC